MLKKKSEESIELLEGLDSRFAEWIAATAYYSMYYRACSLLALLGITSKNHSCVVEILRMFDRKLASMLESYRTLREQAQYYGAKVVIDRESALKDARAFFSSVSKLEASTDFGKKRDELVELLKLV